MTLKRAKFFQNGIKIAIFFQNNCKKSLNGWPSNPRLWYIWVKLIWSQRLLIWTILETFLTVGSIPFL